MDIWLDVPTSVEAVLPRRIILPFDRALLIGWSDPPADIDLPSLYVAPRDGEIGRDSCGAWISEVESRRGIFVNGRRVGSNRRYPLLRNDAIKIGGVVTLRIGWDFEVNPYWLHWEAGAVVSLAKRVRDEKDEAAMPILADALEDAGCTETTILEHLRGPGPHVRECWVIDELLKGM